MLFLHLKDNKSFLLFELPNQTRR